MKEGAARRQRPGCLGAVRPGHSAELTSSLAGPGAEPEHSRELQDFRSPPGRPLPVLHFPLSA